jgi:hypothetical protein
MIKVSLESLLNHVSVGTQSEIYVGMSDLNFIERETLKIGFPNIFFVDESQVPTFKSSRLPDIASQKIFRWKLFFDNYLQNNEFGLFFDADLIFYNEFLGFIRKDIDLLITRKFTKYPINLGVFGIKKNISTSVFFDKWVENNKITLNSSKMSIKANESYGAADQYSLVKTLGIGNELKSGGLHPGIHAIGKLKIQIVDCDILNQVESVILSKSTSIYHVKSGFHSILLKGTRYTKARTKKDSMEIHDLWEGIYQKSKNRILKEYIMNIIRKYKEVINLENEQYLERGIFNSELFLTIGLIIDSKIEIVIDSGRANGFSTEILAKYLSPLGIKVISIEFEKDKSSEQLVNRLSKYENLDCIYGNSMSVIPTIIKKNKRKRIAVILDGPKGIPAVKLMKRLVKKYKNLELGFIHDMRKLEWGKPSKHRFFLENEFDQVFFSDDLDVISEVSFMDKSIWSYNFSNVLNSWKPYNKGNQYVGSYGPTFGIILPSVRDISSSAFENIWNDTLKKLPKLFNPKAIVRKIMRLLNKKFN